MRGYFMSPSSTLPGRHGKITVLPTTPEESPMPDATRKGKEIVALHSVDPILTKDTHIFGRVQIFPPNAEPSLWPTLSFLVVSERGIDPDSRGIRECIKAEFVGSVLSRPHFIESHMKFGTTEELTD